MTETYYDYRIADYTLRIANADTAASKCRSKNEFVAAHNWEKVVARLEKEKVEFMERYSHD